MSRSFATLTK
jgi:hypothetical protein